MSVRKAESRTNSRQVSGGMQALKSFGFWALLAGASFIVGLFILSPLINVAAGSRSTPQAAVPQATAPTTSPRPPSQPSSAVTETPSRRQEQRTDSDVGISVEPPKPAAAPDVQSPGGLDGASQAPDFQVDGERHTSRRRRTDESESDPSRSSRRESEFGSRLRVEDSTPPEHSDRSQDSQPTEPVERPARSERTTRNRTSDNEPAGPRSSRRSDRTRSEGDSGSRERPSPPTDVQKGESIDR
jgi:hypothetical protein